jgi:effector-binding domain-containing protein
MTLKSLLLLCILIILCFPVMGENEISNLEGTWILTSGERIIYGDMTENIDLVASGNLTWLNVSDGMLNITEQRGRKLAGTWEDGIEGSPAAAQKIVGVIGFDNSTVYMVGEGSYFDGRILSPREMELIAREIDSRGEQTAVMKVTKREVGISDQQIQIKNVSAMKVASLMAQGLPFQETVPKAYNELIKWMKAKGLPMSKGSPWGLTIYFDDDPKSVDPSKVRFKVAILVPNETKPISEGKAAVAVLPEHEVAYLTVYGTYETLDKVYSRLNAWVMQKGYSIVDEPREVMVKYNESRPQDWITEVQFPIKR